MVDALEPRVAYSREMRAPGFITATVSRYRSLDLEYAALRVVGRGLFLAVMLMVAFLYVFVRVTDLIAGTNEVLIPTVIVNPDVDLGALAQGAFSRTSASVVSLIGAFTFIASALLTGYALRLGSRRALLGAQGPAVRLFSWRTVVVSVGLAVSVFATWLLTLATSIRQRAWVTLLGREMDPAIVNLGKALAVVVSLAIIVAGVLMVTRIVLDRVTRRALIAAALVAVIVVGANFFLLYSYVGALINPQLSAGIVLVFTILLWVNICVRAYLAALCWVGAQRSTGD
jgi:hypothetical protein